VEWHLILPEVEALQQLLVVLQVFDAYACALVLYGVLQQQLSRFMLDMLD
jgi:hypothetical protein